MESKIAVAPKSVSKRPLEGREQRRAQDRAPQAPPEFFEHERRAALRVERIGALPGEVFANEARFGSFN